MIKLYMIWDRISDRYFSEVAGVIRVETKDHAYVYDHKHAAQVLRDTLMSQEAIMKSEKIPQEIKKPYDLILREVPVDDVPITDYLINRTWTSKIRHGYPFMEALRLCKLEQVRKFNDYIHFNIHTPSHRYRYLMEVS